VPSRAEDFLATDRERERCREALMRSTLGLWGRAEEVERMHGARCEARGERRTRGGRSVGFTGCRGGRVQGECEERSLGWE
jgi:hypothetical protein